MIETAVALCAVGAEKTVSNEIKRLGLSVLESGFGRVRFKTGLEGLYRTLMGGRAIDRVLLEASRFRALDFDALFEGVRRLPWEDFIPPHMGLKVSKIRTNRSKLSAETSIQAVVHKAAAEKLCTKRRINRLPENTDAADLRIFIEKDEVSVLLDLSGEPLFKRGYRTSGGIAPLRETTAAAIIIGAGWKRKFPLYDPFCGSGTIAIEAAMYAWDIAPGIGRRFELDRLLFGDENTGRKVREEFLAKVDFSRLVRIAGSDSDPASVTAARANAERAIALTSKKGGKAPAFKILPMEAAKAVDFIGCAAGTADAAGAGGNTDAGYIITNPPYGRRLGDAESAERTYTEMGCLAANFPGWKLAIISDHSGFESFFGRKADICREITNGAIGSYLYQYEEL